MEEVRNSMEEMVFIDVQGHTGTTNSLDVRATMVNDRLGLYNSLFIWFLPLRDLRGRTELLLSIAEVV
jgi:hypothetical protein